MIQYEDKLLAAIRFNFSITHPYHILLKLGNQLRESDATMLSACEYMQKLYHTSIILHYPPHYLALAALVEARLGKSVTAELNWASDNYINKVDLKDIGEKFKRFWGCIEA